MPVRCAIAQTQKFQRGYANSQKFIRAFLEAGGTVIASSDTTLGAMPGMDLHRELELLVDSGLSPLQALQAATLSPCPAYWSGSRSGNH